MLHGADHALKPDIIDSCAYPDPKVVVVRDCPNRVERRPCIATPDFLDRPIRYRVQHHLVLRVELRRGTVTNELMIKVVMSNGHPIIAIGDL